MMRLIGTCAVIMGLATSALAAPPFTEIEEPIPTLGVIQGIDVNSEFSGLSDSQIKEISVARGFLALEGALKADIKAAETAGDLPQAAQYRYDLGRFYAVHDFHIEALAAFKEISTPDDQLLVQIANSLYGAGRYRAILVEDLLERLQRLPNGRALIAKARARLGAYAAAEKNFAGLSEASRSLNLGVDFFLLRAETAIKVGDLSIAAAAIAQTDEYQLTQDQQYSRQYIRGLLAFERGQLEQSEQVFRNLQLVANEPWNSMASLRIIIAQFEAGKMTSQTALQRLDALRLRNDGHRFRRNLEWARARALEDANDIEGMFASLQNIVTVHAQTDLSTKAAGKIREKLMTLFADSESLPSIATAQIFYENIEFIPPGEAGDGLIREIAHKLVELDLSSHAAELLEHQVFNRLRGFERSQVAADLAKIYVDNKNADAALRVIRSTRIKGLEPEINTRRRVLEARALVLADASDAALNLLDGQTSQPELGLKAEIYWRTQNWVLAGAAYRDLYVEFSDEAPETDAFLRAGISFAMADDGAQLRELLEHGVAEIGGTEEFTMLESLLATNAPGDADNQNSALIFMEAYRNRFSQSAKTTG